MLHCMVTYFLTSDTSKIYHNLTILAKVDLGADIYLQTKMIWRQKRNVSTRYTTLISTEILGCFYTFWWLLLHVNSTGPQGTQIFCQTLFLGISVGVFIFLNCKIKSFYLASTHFYFPRTYPGKFADNFALK